MPGATVQCMCSYHDLRPQAAQAGALAGPTSVSLGWALVSGWGGATGEAQGMEACIFYESLSAW